MTLCQGASPVRCEVNLEAAFQIGAATLGKGLSPAGVEAFLPYYAMGACCALFGCPSDLTLCEVGNG